MSILSVDNISPIGSGTSVTVNSAATLVLNNANSTGIITATELDISGDIDVDGHTDLDNVSIAGVTTITGTGTNGLIKVERASGAGLHIQAQSALGVFGTISNHNLRLISNGNERILLSTNGKVGINESSPDRQLHVRSDGAAAAKLGGESGAAYYMEIGQLASSGSPGFNATGSGASMLFQMNGSEKVRIDSSGRLLVATNSASAANSSADDLVIGSTSQGNNGMSIVTNNANNGGIFFADQDHSVRGGVRYQHGADLAQFYAGGNIVLNLKNKGVGINETSPTEDALVIRGGDTDDTPRLILKRHTDGIQSDGEIIGKIQFMSNENNVDSGNHQPRAEIHGVTVSTSGAAKLDFYTVPNSTTTPIKRMTLNQLGQLTVPNQPSFAVYRNQQAWNIPNGDKMIFNTNRHNVGNHYNTSNGRFTAPVTGSYQLNFYSILQGNYTNAYLETKVNGNRIYGGDIHWSHDQGSVWHTETYSQVVYLNVNDYVELYSYTGTGSGNVAWHGNNWGCWSGFLLG